jgi:lipopolysaccharide export system permease protein
LTGLTLPLLVVIIAPVALFIAILFVLNRLNGDSELIVMSASGMSTGRLLRPFALLIGVVTLLVAAMSLWGVPSSFLTVRDLITRVRADVIARVVREGQFVTVAEGFVFHYRERDPNGALRGIFIQDRRDPEHINTYIAESGETVESGKQNYLILEKGSVQRQTRGELDPAMVSFERYAIDLSQFGSEGEGAPLKPRERSTAALFNLDRNDPYVAENHGRLIAELNDRIINPLYVIVFGLLGFAALGQPRTTRQGRGLAIAAAIGAVLGLRIAGFGASALVAKSLAALVLVYAVPLAGLFGALIVIFGPVKLRRPRLGARAVATQ